MSGLRVDGITKRYGDEQAVGGVSFNVAPGEIVGLVGPNGAGKSTTLRIVTGLVRADTGTVTLDDFSQHTHPREYRTRFGALIEAPALYPMLSARAHLEYVARMRGGADTDETRETLRAVGLDSDSTKPARQFSLGMKQRLGLAMAIFGRPSLLILDELMNALDPTGIAELRSFIRSLPQSRGASVLVSSHLLSELQQTCDRVIFLRQGRLVGEHTLSTAADGALQLMHVRTADDNRALPLLQQQAFVLEASADVAGRILCRVATDEVGLLAPLLVQHGVTLLELTPRAPQLEDEYASVYGDQSQRMLP